MLGASVATAFVFWAVPTVAQPQSLPPRVSASASVPTAPAPAAIAWAGSLSERRLAAEVAKAEADAAKAAFEAGPDQQRANALRMQVEVAKLQAEIAKLQQETSNGGTGGAVWITAGSSLLAALIAVVGIFVTARHSIRQALQNRIGVLDLKHYDQRTEAYRALLKAMEPLATQVDCPPLRPADCRAMAAELRRQYYSGCGLLLTADARAWWSCLVAVLARASEKEVLLVPADSASYSKECSEPELVKHRRTLGLTCDEKPERERERCYEYEFAGPTVPSHHATSEIQDYVVLQFTASRFRSELSKDLQSRRQIADLV